MVVDFRQYTLKTGAVQAFLEMFQNEDSSRSGHPRQFHGLYFAPKSAISTRS
jgi:hypothetical protein